MPKICRHDMGVGGFCICPKCDTRIEHRDGIPCQDERCPQCGSKMLREGSEHHKMFLEKHKNKAD
ncbi:MAG: ferredoxin [Gammaproteobacteria bacterium]|nr:ferredoxin [Gammaproteobacteria bacterium]